MRNPQINDTWRQGGSTHPHNFPSTTPIGARLRRFALPASHAKDGCLLLECISNSQPLLIVFFFKNICFLKIVWKLTFESFLCVQKLAIFTASIGVYKAVYYRFSVPGLWKLTFRFLCENWLCFFSGRWQFSQTDSVVAAECLSVIRFGALVGKSWFASVVVSILLPHKLKLFS